MNKEKEKLSKKMYGFVYRGEKWTCSNYAFDEDKEV